MKILRIIFWPLIMFKNILDANWWANKITDKTNMEEKKKDKKDLSNNKIED